MEPSFLRRKDDGSYIVVLLIVIIIGVATGNLLSNWISAKYVEYQIKVATHDLNQELKRQSRIANAQSQASHEQAANRRTQLQAAQQRQRTNDQTGRMLEQTCTEWRKADSNLKTYTTGVEAAKHCMRYNTYVQNGVLIQP